MWAPPRYTGGVTDGQGVMLFAQCSAYSGQVTGVTDERTQ